MKATNPFPQKAVPWLLLAALLGAVVVSVGRGPCATCGLVPMQALPEGVEKPATSGHR